MKTTIVFFFSLIVGWQFTFSQFGAEFAGYNADNESFGMQPMLQYAFLQMESKLLADDGKIDIKGSRFLNRNFTVGDIYTNEGLEGRAYMRYDAYNDEVELKLRDKDSSGFMLKKDKNIYCVLSGKEMYFKSYFDKKNEIKDGYLFKVAETDSLTLFERRLKRFKDGKEPATSFELPVASRFVSDRELYYEDKATGRINFLRPNKKAIVNLFAHQSDKTLQIKNFISKHRLDLKEPKSVAQVFYYYNNLE